jgi:photosystem II stability/assembly factor-like uncharacterized protein
MAVLSVVALSVVAVGAITVLTPSSTLRSSGNSGSHWVTPHGEGEAPFVPIAGGATTSSGGFNAVSCPTVGECVAVGGDNESGGVASTSNDLGATWNQGSMALGEPQLDAVNCASESNCVAVGQGAAVTSNDGGKTWRSHTIPTANTTLLGVDCPSSKLCVSVGVSPGNNGPFSGELMVSFDGGAAWSVPKVPASLGALGSVACPTSKFCVAVGASILVTTDGGTNWSIRAVNGGTGVLRSVSCSSATSCVALGPNPAGIQDANASAFEVVTYDGGATWSAVTLPPGSSMLDVVSCSGATECVAAGSGQSGGAAPVLRSTDGGDSWAPAQPWSSTVTSVSSVSCSAQTGCVFVGRAGDVPVSGLRGGSSHPVTAWVRTQKGASS